MLIGSSLAISSHDAIDADADADAHSAQTLGDGEAMHVRVDIWGRSFAPRQQFWGRAAAMSLFLASLADADTSLRSDHLRESL